MDLARICIPLVRINPSNISHSCVHAFDIKLVLEADGKSMKGTTGRVVFNEVIVQFFGPINSLTKHDLVKAVILHINIISNDTEERLTIQVTGTTGDLAYNLVCNRCSLAKRLGYLKSGVMA